jgi:phosphohistidine phosphatase
MLTEPDKQLYLLRHAKSSWDDPELDDHDRPLAPRGERAAKVMCKHLERERIDPDVVLCSSARRTRETLERIRPALGDDAQVEVEDGLYGATADGLIERLRDLDDDTDSVMLIGHNPAIEELALTLAGSGDQLPEMRRKYPTGALATLAFDGRWRDLGPAVAELTDFVKPKQLTKR